MENYQNIHLGNHFDNFIAGKLDSGEYSSVSELLRSALRLLENQDRKIEQLSELLEEGERSELIENFDSESFLKEMRAKYGNL